MYYEWFVFSWNKTSNPIRNLKYTDQETYDGRRYYRTHASVFVLCTGNA